MYASGKPGGATNLSGLSDVNVPSPNDNDHLVYDNGSSLWLPVAAAAGGDTYVDRGDPSGWDFDVGDFTYDATWNEWDVSGIVPAGAAGKLVRFLGLVRHSGIGAELMFREPGNSNAINTDKIISQVAATNQGRTFEVLCDANRKIEYYGEAGWTPTYYCIRGWWI